MPEPSSSASSDPSRNPLDGTALATALTSGSDLWRSLEVVPEIGSTNAALLAAAAEDAPEGTVLAAEHQVTGRGRLDRAWSSPPGAGITVSFLLRPDVPAARRVPELHDLRACLDQPPQDRSLANDLGVVPRVGRRRH